jgi:isoleucyl-tRNA synthetase
MDLTRKVIEMGLSLRAENGIKVRQPLAALYVSDKNLKDDLAELVKDELNVKEVRVGRIDKASNVQKREEKGIKIGLDIEITQELKLEGEMRELIRHIQNARKQAGFNVEDRIQVAYKGGVEIFANFRDELTKEVLADSIVEFEQGSGQFDIEKTIKINGADIAFWLKKA